MRPEARETHPSVPKWFPYLCNAVPSAFGGVEYGFLGNGFRKQ